MVLVPLGKMFEDMIGVLPYVFLRHMAVPAHVLLASTDFLAVSYKPHKREFLSVVGFLFAQCGTVLRDGAAVGLLFLCDSKG